MYHHGTCPVAEHVCIVACCVYDAICNSTYLMIRAYHAILPDSFHLVDRGHLAYQMLCSQQVNVTLGDGIWPDGYNLDGDDIFIHLLTHLESVLPFETLPPQLFH